MMSQVLKHFREFRTFLESYLAFSVVTSFLFCILLYYAFRLLTHFAFFFNSATVHGKKTTLLQT